MLEVLLLPFECNDIVDRRLLMMLSSDHPWESGLSIGRHAATIATPISSMPQNIRMLTRPVTIRQAGDTSFSEHSPISSSERTLATVAFENTKLHQIWPGIKDLKEFYKMGPVFLQKMLDEWCHKQLLCVRFSSLSDFHLSRGY